MNTQRSADKKTENQLFTILIVDDEKDLRDIYEFGFSKAGFRVLTAVSGYEAAAILEREPIDLIVSDFRMPNGDGLDVLRAANRLRKQSIIPVIIITGWIEPGVIDAMREGAAAVHSKPVAFHNILVDVKNSLQLATEFHTNRRHQPRKELSTAVELYTETQGHFLTMESVDISLGGIKLKNSPEPLMVNQTYTFRLKQLGKQQMSNDFVAHGICKWQRPISSKSDDDNTKVYSIGMSFDDGTKERLLVREILKKLA